MSQSARIRDLKRTKSNSGASQTAKTDAEDEDFSKLSPEELKEKLARARREVSNRDTTIKALQRNYETLAATHEEAQGDHLRRKTAFDQLSDKFAEIQVKLSKDENTIRTLRSQVEGLEEKVKDSGAKDAEHLRRKTAFDQLSDTFAATQAKLDKEEAKNRLLNQKLEEVEASSQGAKLAVEKAELENEKLKRAVVKAQQEVKELQFRVFKEEEGTKETSETIRKLQKELAAKESGLEIVRGEARNLQKEMGFRDQEIEELRSASAQQNELVRRDMKNKEMELKDLKNQVVAAKEKLQEQAKGLEAKGAEGSKLAQDLKQARAKVKEQEDQLRVLGVKNSDNKAKAEDLGGQVSELTKQNLNLKSQIEASGLGAEASRAEMARLKGELESARRGYDELVNSMHGELDRCKLEAKRHEVESERIRGELLKAKEVVSEEERKRAKDVEGREAESRALLARLEAEKQEIMSKMALEEKKQKEEISRSASSAMSKIRALEETMAKEREARYAADRERTEELQRREQAEALRAKTEALKQRIEEAKIVAEARALEAESRRQEAEAEWAKKYETELSRRKQAEDRVTKLDMTVIQLESRCQTLTEELKTSGSGNLELKKLAEGLGEEAKVLRIQLESVSQEKAELQKQVDQIRREDLRHLSQAEGLRRELEGLEGELVQAQGQSKTLEVSLQQAQNQNNQLKQDHLVSRGDWEQKFRELGSLKDKLTDQLRGLEAALETANRELRARDAELRSSSSQLKLLKDEGSSKDLNLQKLEGKLKEREDAWNTLDGLGGRAREVLGVVKKLQAASDAMESQVTCLHCLAPLKNCVTLVPCGHNICGNCWDDAQTGSGCCPECGSETSEHVESEALDQISAKFVYQKQALAQLLNTHILDVKA